VAGLGENEFLQFQFNPGKVEAAASGPGEVGGEPLEQLAGDATGLGLKNLAERVVVDGFSQIVLPGGRGHGRNGKPGRA